MKELQKKSQAKFELRKRNSLAAMLVAFIATSTIEVGIARAADYLPPGTIPPELAPAPPGSGETAKPVVGGDGGVPSAPPTGNAISPPPNGTRFDTTEEKAPTHDNYYLNKDGRGRRLIMQTPPDGGAVNYETEKSLQKYDFIHYPYPPTVPGPAFQRLVPDRKARDGKRIISRPTKAIEKDTRTTRFERDEPNSGWAAIEKNEEPLPIVRKFCRKIVILGVVFATVFMAFAAFSLVLGHREGGQRVIGTAAGLMLLLMGYSIFKVIQINAWRYASVVVYDWTSPSFENKRQSLKRANTPVVPPEPGGPRRANLPVRPLGGPQFH